MERNNLAFKCTCEKGDVVLRTSRKPQSYGKQYYACPCSKPGTQDRGCGYFMWKDDLIRRLSFSLEPSTPPSSFLGPSTRPNKRTRDDDKDTRGTLEMERHPENHTLESAVILHELYNDIGKLGLD
ncbi:phospholipase-like protein [Tanacetum coccineum]